MTLRLLLFSYISYIQNQTSWHLFSVIQCSSTFLLVWILSTVWIRVNVGLVLLHFKPSGSYDLFKEKMKKKYCSCHWQIFSMYMLLICLLLVLYLCCFCLVFFCFPAFVSDCRFPFALNIPLGFLYFTYL